MNKPRHVVISLSKQQLACYVGEQWVCSYPVSTAKNGAGELQDSECTPRGVHQVHQVIGLDCPLNSVFIARQWTGEVYTPALAQQHPERDWILTRVIQLDGLEPGRNRGGLVDSLQRFIYIHGSPGSLATPESHGCVRMSSLDVVQLADWVEVGTHVCINEQ